jgi:PAS domain S-box-containing protein
MTLGNTPAGILLNPNTVRWGLILLFIAVAIGCLIGAVSGSRLRRRDTQLGLRAVLLTNGLWLGFQSLGLAITDEALSSAIYVGGLICGLTGVGAWMYFVSAYTGRSYHRNRRYRGLAVSVYLGLLIIKLTNPLYGLYVSTELQRSPYTHLVVEPQLFYWVSFSLTYTLVAISFYWVVKTLRRSPFPSGSVSALGVLALLPIIPRAAISALPNEALPPIMLGLSFEPLGVTAFLAGVLVFVEKPFRQFEHSARSKVFEDADDATFVYDTDGRLVEMNTQAQTLETDASDTFERIETVERAFGPVSQLSATDTIPIELNGTPRYFEITANRMATGSEVVGTVVTVRDITERRARKRDLELKENAMDEANVGITISDPTSDDNPLVYVNDGFVEQTGYSREDAVGRNCRFLQNDDKDQPALTDLREAIAADEDITVELRNYRKNGERFRNRLSVTPIFNEAGELVNHVGIQQDVTAVRESQRELRAERERFELLMESIDEYAFLTVDEEGLIRTWNDSATNLFGYDETAALGMPIRNLHPTAEREAGRPGRLLQQARHAGEASDDGWRVRADGSEFYADIRYAPLRDDNGDIDGYGLIVNDRTEQRRQQRRTERFVEESEDVVTIVDPDGTVTYASGSTERVFGYDPNSLVGENFFDYLHPSGREQAMETFFSCVDDSQSATTECRLRSPDGDWFNTETQYRNMLDDDAIEGILVYLRDVTEKKERTRRFESIFNQTFQFTGLLEPDGTIIEVNDTALNFGGFERTDIVGTPFFEAPWWTHSEAVYDNVREAIERAASGEFVRYETEVRGINGLAVIDFSVKPITDEDDDVSLLVAEGRDITARQRHRQHLEVMQRVMRHNMRNDLTKVRGWTQVMSEESDAEKRAEQLETVEAVLDKWDSMSEKMRQVKQVLQPGDGELATTALGPLIEDATCQLREEHNAATILTEGTDSESARVPTTFRQAVHELVENAIKLEGTATVEITARSGDDWVEISVTDDGPGMPEMEAEVLETGEEDPLNHGKGLGLWMVRMIVTQAGGNVSVESTTDGTEVRLRSPTILPH